MSPFADEFLRIKQAGLGTLAASVGGGAALGALGSHAAGVDPSQGALAGAVLGTGVTRQGYKWKRPAALGVLGATGYYGTQAVENQVNRDLAVSDAYNRYTLNAPAVTPGRWM